MPGCVQAACLWLLSAEAGSSYAPAALFSPEGSPNSGGEVLLRYGIDPAGLHDRPLETDASSLPQAFPLAKYVLVPRKGKTLSSANCARSLTRKR